MNALAHQHFGQFAAFRLDLNNGFYKLVRYIAADHYYNGIAVYRLFAGSNGEPISRATDRGNWRREFVEHKRMWLIRATQDEFVLERNGVFLAGGHENRARRCQKQSNQNQSFQLHSVLSLN